MRKLMLSGRTVFVSEEQVFPVTDKAGKETGETRKCTYVTLAVRNRNSENDDMITIRYWNDRSEFAQKHLNLHDPAKVKALNDALDKHKVKEYSKLPADVKKKVKPNTIHSRVISVSGDFKMFTRPTKAKAKVKYDGKTLLFPYTFDQNQFVVDETYDTTLLDARPKWAKTNTTVEAEVVEEDEGVVEVEVVEDEESSSNSGVVIDGETIPESDIPA